MVILTPDILKKAGFEFRGLHWQGEYSKYQLKNFAIMGNRDHYYYMTHLDNGAHGAPFRYVHELQNLYRVITGEELEINL